MDHESKQGQGQGHGKRKKDDEAAASSGNGVPRRFSLRARRAKRRRPNDAEKQSVDKGIDAWKKIVADGAEGVGAAARARAIVYKKAERWNAFIEVLKEAVEKANWASPEDKIPVLEEMIEVYRDRLKLDVMVVNAFNQILSIQPDNFDAADALAAQYEAMKRWPDLIALLRKKAAGRRVGRGQDRAAPAGREPVPREVLEPGRGDQGLRDDPRARSRQQRGARRSSSRCTRSAATGRS